MNTPLPTIPAELALDPRFSDGWRDSDGRNCYQVLAAQVGEPDAEWIWRRAVDLFEGHHGAPGSARFGAPLRGAS